MKHATPEASGYDWVEGPYNTREEALEDRPLSERGIIK